MPEYTYTAKTKDAKTIRDTEDASSKDELAGRLRSRELFIISIEEVKKEKPIFSFLSSKQTFRKRSSIKLQDLAFFARNLSTTLSSGVTLLRSLEVIASQIESAKLEKIIRECSQNVRDGLSLSEAITKYPKVFAGVWQGIMEVGESSGNLPLVLERLAEHLEMRIDFERRIKSALIYPCILLVAAVAATFAFFKFILPKFASLFEGFKVELPLMTRIVLRLSTFLEKKFSLFIGAFFVLMIVIFSIRNQPAFKKFFKMLSLKLPLAGDILSLLSLERLTSTIYILLESGLPLVYTLEIAARSTGNPAFEKNILAIKERVRKGNSLSVEFKRANVFPLLVSEMAKIGEETGSMPEIFKKIAVYYQRQLTTKVERLVAAFEPLMIVFMALIIGTLVISLFLPLFKLATLAG